MTDHTHASAVLPCPACARSSTFCLNVDDRTGKHHRCCDGCGHQFTTRENKPGPPGQTGPA